MNVLKVQSKVADKNTKATVIKDDNGYYKVTLGFLNTYNKAGVFYRLVDYDKFLGKNSLVGKRIDEGILIGEDNHPNVDGFSELELKRRTLFLDKKNASIHIKAIEVNKTGEIDKTFNLPVYQIFGWVKPIGDTKQVMIDLLECEDSNVSFSLRSVVRQNRIGGILVRDFLLISTWDTVHSNGVKNATQWNAAGFENDMVVVLDSINDLDDVVKGFESSGMTCKDGICTIEHIKTEMSNQRHVNTIYDW